MSTTSTGQRLSEKTNTMGVASISSKRRLENPNGEEDYISAKLAKRTLFVDSDVQDTTGHENSSDFLTTSILARTLLTTTSSPHLSSNPLESLKSSLEALPAPTMLESEEIRSTFLPPKTTIQDATDLEFSSLLCHERTLATVTVLSPIDEDTSEWTNPNAKPPVTPVSSTMSDQVITEDENGKSYFNLGTADATILAKKSSIGDTSWTSCNDFNDDGSSSSCESISSEDLFNSGEEFDASDDEEELHSYKQQRSTVLHLSLCKLNMFRTQQCVEPSLHRSVLICNTLRHIEQEIKNEDEAVDETLKSRETLPSFWPSASNCLPQNSNSNNQPQITDTRPSGSADVSLNGHDPYLSPNPYTEAPYSSYDYNSLRPTPFHTTSYDYERDLPVVNTSTQQLLSDVSSPPTLLECDSGYAEDLELSSYYYGNSSSSATQPLPGNDFGSSPNLVNTPVPSIAGSDSVSETSFLHCGFTSGLTMDVESSVISTSNEPLLASAIGSNNIVDIEIRNSSLTNTLTNSCLAPVEQTSTCDYLERTKSSSIMDGSSSTHCWSKIAPMTIKEVVVHMPPTFAQQDSQCGLESRRRDFSRSHGNHHHNLPMDSLISSAYSASI